MSAAATAQAGEGRRILMVTHVVPIPPGAGNEQRVYRLLRWLRDEGYQVILMLRPQPAQTLDEPRRRALLELVHDIQEIPQGPPRRYLLSEEKAAPVLWRSLSRRALDGMYNHLGGPLYTRHVKPLLLRRRAAALPRVDPEAPRRAAARRVEEGMCPPWLVEEVARRCQQDRPLAVIAEYIWMTGCLRVVPPGVLKLIDCHDMFSRRREQVESLGISDPMAISAALEAEMLDRGDVAIAIHEGERQQMAALGVRCEVISVGVDMEPLAPERAPAPGSARDAAAGTVPGRILCVASDNPVNVHGLREFLSQAWPSIRRQHPGASLHLAGRATRHLTAPDASVRLSGFLPDLAAAYGEAEIVINPVIGGTGLKIKTIEALAQSKPLVVWPNGADGLGPPEALPCLVAQSWDEFTDHTLLLLRDAARRAQLAQLAAAYIKTHYGSEVVYRPLREVLERHARRVAMPAPGAASVGRW